MGKGTSSVWSWRYCLKMISRQVVLRFLLVMAASGEEGEVLYRLGACGYREVMGASKYDSFGNRCLCFTSNFGENKERCWDLFDFHSSPGKEQVVYLVWLSRCA